MLIFMKTLKRVLILFLMTLTAVQLVACGVATSVPTVTATTMPTSTLVIPTSTELPPTPSSTSTQTSIPISSPPDGLHMAYVIDGNLYFQDGSNSVVQLTQNGENWQPTFSDDGEKIVFLHGKDWGEIDSINIDGSQEQVLVTSSLLMTLDNSYNESTKPHSLTFVPGTHLLLFATQEFESNVGKWNGDLLVVDTDTAKITSLLPMGQVSGFNVSPDGKYIAIDTAGEINVIDIGGRSIHRNLLTYTPSEPIFLSPSVHWMPDSIGLIVILPIPTSYEGNEPPDYAVWRYTFNGSPGVQVPLDPVPSDHNMARVSLDGNWIIFNSHGQNAFYIGNLRTGHTELYDSQYYVQHYDWSWSPDNEHFVYSTPPGNTLYLGSVNGLPELIGEGVFHGWIDSNRFLYYANKNIVMGDTKGSKQIILVDHESFINRTTIFTFILPKTLKR